MRRKLAPVALLSLLAAGQPAERERAAAAARELGQVLMQLLEAELQRGGYAGAVRACSESAQTATGEFARERGLEIRRVSLKARNRRDLADEWEAARLKEWEAAGKPPAEFFTVVEEGGRRYARYLKPIVIQPMCLGCHGERDKLAPEVREVLDRRYPGDRATGYKAGDLRGAFTVTIPLRP